MSAQQLPPDPSLEQLKKQAKDLQAAYKSGETEAAGRIQSSHPKFTESSAADVLAAGLTLRDAQLVIAREYGFGTWKELKAQVEGPAVPGGAEGIRELAAEDPDKVAGVLREMLTTPRTAALLLFALGQQTTSELMKYLTDAEIEAVVEAFSNLDEVSEKEQDEALAQFARQRRDGGDTRQVNQGHADFAFGALAGAVGRRRANEIFKRHQISASVEISQPPLSEEYQANKKALAEMLGRTPTRQLGLEELRGMVVGLAEVARAEGIVALESFVESSVSLEGILRDGLCLIIDATAPEVVADLLDTQRQALIASVDTRCKMIIAGVRGIQQGENPRIIGHKLGAFYNVPTDQVAEPSS